MFQTENPPHRNGTRISTRRHGITLIEMLVGMAITLVMMGALVTVFANITGSVSNRRATIELSTQLRHVRNVMQRDLQGATCPTVPWQRPESNHGYFELVEGPHTDTEPSALTDGFPFDYDGDGVSDELDDPDGDGVPDEPDQIVSLLPRYGGTPEGAAISLDGTLVQRVGGIVVSTLNGLGDYDDILALTVRNEEEPFVGLVPDSTTVRTDVNDAEAFPDWGSSTIESPLAEVVWFAVENPIDSANGFFGEAGLRTIYRRVLLIAPWVTPYHYRFVASNGDVTENDTYRDGVAIRTKPGVVRILRDSVDNSSLEGRTEALASLIAFQEKFDLSVRLEWDPSLGDNSSGNGGRWVIIANTLADLTKRENRYEHHHFLFDDAAPENSRRTFPYAMVSVGGGYSGSSGAKKAVQFVNDREIGGPVTDSVAQANLLVVGSQPFTQFEPLVIAYNIVAAGSKYNVRPFVYVDAESIVGVAPEGGLPATARAMLNDQGEVVNVIRGLVPFWGPRRGEDVMLTDALAFDLRVYDPGAPLFREPNTETVLKPGDPGWPAAYRADILESDGLVGDEKYESSLSPVDSGLPGHPTLPAYEYLGQGAYVDLGYGFLSDRRIAFAPLPPIPLRPNDPFYVSGINAVDPWFFFPRWTPDRQAFPLAPGYCVYDTWSFSYENNGMNEDADFDAAGLPMVDEGTNGFDDRDPTIDGVSNRVVDHVDDTKHSGVDDVDERETNPPYDRPLRGIQVRLRAFERDSQQIREVSVVQHFVPD